MDLKVCKFGGTSVESPVQIEKIAGILNADSSRRLVVVSALAGVTEWLSNLYFNNHKFYSENEKRSGSNGYTYKKSSLTQKDLIEKILDKHKIIVNAYGLDKSIVDDLEYSIHDRLTHPYSMHDMLGLGELTSSKLLSKILGANLLDPRRYIHVNENKGDNPITYDWMKDLSLDKLSIVGGFIGNESTNRKVFRTRILERGGSNLTAAYFLKGTPATILENWTDVDGLCVVDPRLFPGEIIPVVDICSFKETRELTYNGSKILHEETIGPVRNTNKAINIRNTNNPNHPGTMIVKSYEHKKPIVGIAGKKDFISIDVEKYMLGSAIGAGEMLFDVLKSNGVSYEHSPTGEDSILFLIHKDDMGNKESKILEEMTTRLRPDDLKVERDIAMIAIVGERIKYHPRIDAKIINSLDEANIPIPIINKGSEDSIILGVYNKDYEMAIKKLYTSLLK